MYFRVVGATLGRIWLTWLAGGAGGSRGGARRVRKDGGRGGALLHLPPGASPCDDVPKAV